MSSDVTSSRAVRVSADFVEAWKQDHLTELRCQHASRALSSQEQYQATTILSPVTRASSLV